MVALDNSDIAHPPEPAPTSQRFTADQCIDSKGKMRILGGYAGMNLLLTDSATTLAVEKNFDMQLIRICEAPFRRDQRISAMFLAGRSLLVYPMGIMHFKSSTLLRMVAAENNAVRGWAQTSHAPVALLRAPVTQGGLGVRSLVQIYEVTRLVQMYRLLTSPDEIIRSQSYCLIAARGSMRNGTQVVAPAHDRILRSKSAAVQRNDGARSPNSPLINVPMANRAVFFEWETRAIPTAGQLAKSVFPDVDEWAMLSYKHGIVISRAVIETTVHMSIRVQDKKVNNDAELKKALLKQIDQYWSRALNERRPIGDKSSPASLGAIYWPIPRGSDLNRNKRKLMNLPSHFTEYQMGVLTRLIAREWPTRVASHSHPDGRCRYGCPCPETVDHVLASVSAHPPLMQTAARHRHDSGVQEVVIALENAKMYVIEAEGCKITSYPEPPHELLVIRNALSTYRTSKVNIPGSHTKPDIVAFDPNGGGILIVDMSFASEPRIETMDEIRSAVEKHPYWWDAKGLARVNTHGECLWGVSNDSTRAPVRLQDLLSLPRAVTANDNTLIPVSWDNVDAMLSVHTKRRTQIHECDAKHGPQRARAIKLLGTKTYWYSPRARYINRYTELLAQLKSALLVDPLSAPGELVSQQRHAAEMSSRKKDNNGAAMFTRHRVVPLVMGSAGWISRALERELQLLFRRGKKFPLATKLAESLTTIAYHTALTIHRLWFKS